MLYHEIPCPECYGFGYRSEVRANSICALQCVKCRGAGSIVAPMTNGEIIRTCSNEQLAKVYGNLKTYAIFSGGDNNRLLGESPEELLVWLNKETDDIDVKTIFDFIDEKEYEHPYLKVVNK